MQRWSLNEDWINMSVKWRNFKKTKKSTKVLAPPPRLHSHAPTQWKAWCVYCMLCTYTFPSDHTLIVTSGMSKLGVGTQQCLRSSVGSRVFEREADQETDLTHWFRVCCLNGSQDQSDNGSDVCTLQIRFQDKVKSISDLAGYFSEEYNLPVLKLITLIFGCSCWCSIHNIT